MPNHGIMKNATAHDFVYRDTRPTPFKVVAFDNETERKDFAEFLLFHRKRKQADLREAKKSPCFGSHKGASETYHNGSGYHAYKCDVCGEKWTEDSGD
jgi:hypothetical protein